jgi:hypothetical protein
MLSRHKLHARKLDYLRGRAGLSNDSSKPGVSSGDLMENSMKNLILAAVAALGLATTVVSAANASSTVAGDAQATRMQQTGSYSR